MTHPRRWPFWIVAGVVAGLYLQWAVLVPLVMS